MTLVRQLPYANPDSSGLPVFPLPTAIEREVFSHPNVKRWFRADIGVSGESWRCVKTGALLIKSAAGMPELVTLAAYGNRPSLLFANGAAEHLWDGGAGLVPATAALSLVMVGRSGPKDNGFPVGASDSLGNTTTLLHNSTVASFGSLGFVFNATAPATNLGGTVSVAAQLYYEDGPNLMIGSYDSAAGTKVAFRANLGAIETTGNPVINATANKAVNLQIGGIKNSAGAVVSPIVGGDVSEIIVLDTALHVDTTLRAKIETMLQTRYGLW